MDVRFKNLHGRVFGCHLIEEYSSAWNQNFYPVPKLLIQSLKYHQLIFLVSRCFFLFFLLFFFVRTIFMVIYLQETRNNSAIAFICSTSQWIFGVNNIYCIHSAKWSPGLAFLCCRVVFSNLRGKYSLTRAWLGPFQH